MNYEISQDGCLVEDRLIERVLGRRIKDKGQEQSVRFSLRMVGLQRIPRYCNAFDQFSANALQSRGCRLPV